MARRTVHDEPLALAAGDVYQGVSEDSQMPSRHPFLLARQEGEPSDVHLRKPLDVELEGRLEWQFEQAAHRISPEQTCDGGSGSGSLRTT